MNDMEKQAAATSLLKKLSIPAGALAAGGIGGFAVGQRKGAAKAVDAMSNEFSAANTIENQQIANHFYQKGLEAKMNKTAGVKIDKMKAIGAKVIDAIKNSPKAGADFAKKQGNTVKDSFTTLAGSPARVAAAHRLGLGTKATMRQLGSDLSKSKAALTILGVGGVGGAAGVNALVGHDKTAGAKIDAIKSFGKSVLKAIKDSPTTSMNFAKKQGNTVKDSFTTLAGSPTRVAAAHKLGLGTKATMRQLGSDLSKSKAALTILGTGAVGGGLGINALVNRKK